MFKKLIFVLICVIFSLICVISGYAQEETLTITTYYPSPYGVYREMRSQRMAVGDDYIQGSYVCWEGDTGCSGSPMIPSANDVDLIVQGNVGIGTTQPQGSLEIATDTVGNFYNPNYHGPVINMVSPPSPNNNNVASIIRMFTNITGDAQYSINAGSGNVVPNSNFRICDETPGHAILDRLVITPTGNVGIGTTAPERLLHISSDNPPAAPAIIIEEHGNSGLGTGDLFFRKSRGTALALQDVQANDILGAVYYGGYYNGNWQPYPSSIQGIVEAFSGNFIRPGLSFKTTDNAGVLRESKNRSKWQRRHRDDCTCVL